MFALTGVIRDYAWGSYKAIPEFLGQEPSASPIAELWFGAHPTAPSPICGLDTHLGDLIQADPLGTLGAHAVEQFGEELPFLFKLLAPAEPLSMQVHPSLTQARDGYARAQGAGEGAPLDYVDANHKPELLLPFTEFEALSGLRSAKEVADALTGLSHPIVTRVREILEQLEENSAVGEAFTYILTETSAGDVHDIAKQCRNRLAQGTSPSVYSDEVVTRLHEAYPGDRGVIGSLLLIPRVLQPGEAMFVPAGTVHAYLSGLGAEIMANSDNVLRAGLTPKHVDVPELLKVIDSTSQPRVYSELNRETTAIRFDTPVRDFALSVISARAERVSVSAGGPRIVLAYDKGVELTVEHPDPRGQTKAVLKRGEAVFVAHDEGELRVNNGRILHASIAA